MTSPNPVPDAGRTPRTDEVIRKATDEPQTPGEALKAVCLALNDFARQLERELQAERERCEGWKTADETHRAEVQAIGKKCIEYQERASQASSRAYEAAALLKECVEVINAFDPLIRGDARLWVVQDQKITPLLKRVDEAIRQLAEKERK